jgi:hypothetical protein
VPSFALSTSAVLRFASFSRHQYFVYCAAALTHHYHPWFSLYLIDTSTPIESISPPSPSMTPKSSASAPRSNRHHERSLSLQLVPRSIPTRPQPSPAHSTHYRSPSPSRFPRFEETSVSEKSRCDGVIQTSPPKAEEASTSWDDAPESLSSRHQSLPPSASSLRHLTHQNSACPDYPLSPIPDTASAHFAVPLPSLHSGYLHPPRKIRLWSIVKPWLPVLVYISTSLGFVIAIAFWKTQVFEGALYYPIFPPALSAISVPFNSESIANIVRLRLSVYARSSGQPVQLAQGRQKFWLRRSLFPHLHNYIS